VKASIFADSFITLFVGLVVGIFRRKFDFVNAEPYIYCNHSAAAVAVH